MVSNEYSFSRASWVCSLMPALGTSQLLVSSALGHWIPSSGTPMKTQRGGEGKRRGRGTGERKREVGRDTERGELKNKKINLNNKLK